MFSCYYCSINLKRQWEHSGFCPDTSSLVPYAFHMIFFCSDFRNKSNGIFLLGVDFFLHTNFDFLTSLFDKIFLYHSKGFVVLSFNLKRFFTFLPVFFLQSCGGLTEYLCSVWFFYYLIKNINFTCKKMFHLRLVFVKLWGFENCQVCQFLD